MVLFNPQPATRHITSGSKFRVLSTGIKVVMPKFTEEISLSGWVCSVFANLGYEVHDIQGYNAADPTSKMALMTYVREYFARVKVFVDILTGKEPATYEKGE